MTYDELIAHYQGETKAATALGIDRQRVHWWKTKGIPIKDQIDYEVVTGGALRADLPAAVRVA